MTEGMTQLREPVHKFSAKSIENLCTCHHDLIRVMIAVADHYDITILEGHRSNERQEMLFRQGTTKLRAGESKHNKTPSLAVDVAPYPLDWNDRERWLLFCGFVKGIAAGMGVCIRSGADWDGDGYTNDQRFHDMPHFELVQST